MADQALQGSSVGIGNEKRFGGVVFIPWEKRQGLATLVHGISVNTTGNSEHRWYIILDKAEAPIEEQARRDCWGTGFVQLSVTFTSA